MALARDSVLVSDPEIAMPRLPQQRKRATRRPRGGRTSGDAGGWRVGDAK